MAKAEGFVRSVVLRREEIEDFDAYPFSIPGIRGLDELQLDPRVTLLAGENGSGKSTLVEAIAVAAGFNAEGGSSNMMSARATRIPSCTSTYDSSAEREQPRPATSSARKASSTSRLTSRRSRRPPNPTAESLSTNSLTGSRFSRSC
jgi:predicted ATPase